MFYREGSVYKLFNRDREISGPFKLLENHHTFLVFENNIIVQKKDITEEDDAFEQASREPNLWFIEATEPQTPPRKTPRGHSKTPRTRGHFRKSKKTRKNRK
jgi:hypothetical protein